jgi:epoxyqueuosine reductase
MQPERITTDSPLTLAERIRRLGLTLGFADVRFGPPDTEQHRHNFEQWLDQDYHGDMTWLENNQDKRFDAATLQPGTRTVISVRMNYLPEHTDDEQVLTSPELAYISRYTLGRDYHKVLRKRLTQFAKAISDLAAQDNYRPFVDSAPLLERQLAEQSGLGWIGKNSLLLAPGQGSWFFLGELCTDLELPFDEPLNKGHCGSCSQCMVDCPTNAFIAPGVLDARRCISYLTIEYDGVIDETLRPLMGNRIYGCDDCQLVCPHNRKAPNTTEDDFKPRHELQRVSLLTLFSWDEKTFLSRTEGSAIRRIGFEKWQRNLAIALGNGPVTDQAIDSLQSNLGRCSSMVDEHIHWALRNLKARSASPSDR